MFEGIPAGILPCSAPVKPRRQSAGITIGFWQYVYPAVWFTFTGGPSSHPGLLIVVITPEMENT